MTTMDTTLSMPRLGGEYSSSQSNTVFDFTMVSGTNKVIKVDGDVNNPTFIGERDAVCDGERDGGWVRNIRHAGERCRGWKC